MHSSVTIDTDMYLRNSNKYAQDPDPYGPLTKANLTYVHTWKSFITVKRHRHRHTDLSMCFRWI